MSEYKIYIKNAYDENATPISLEDKFTGLKYSKCIGLFDKGARMDVYSEEYSDSDTLRIWQGDNIARKATIITITLYFTGNDRKAQYEAFYNTIKQGRWLYWDSVRLKQALVILKDEFKPNDEVYKGSTPYFEVSFKLQNLWGECKDCDDSGNLI